MRWFRYRQRFLGVLALFALGLQLVVSFAHIGTEVVPASDIADNASFSALSADIPPSPATPSDHGGGLPHHVCDICISIGLLGSALHTGSPQCTTPGLSPRCRNAGRWRIPTIIGSIHFLPDPRTAGRLIIKLLIGAPQLRGKRPRRAQRQGLRIGHKEPSSWSDHFETSWFGGSLALCSLGHTAERAPPRLREDEERSHLRRRRLRHRRSPHMDLRQLVFRLRHARSEKQSGAGCSPARNWRRLRRSMSPRSGSTASSPSPRRDEKEVPFEEPVNYFPRVQWKGDGADAALHLAAQDASQGEATQRQHLRRPLFRRFRLRGEKSGRAGRSAGRLQIVGPRPAIR